MAEQDLVIRIESALPADDVYAAITDVRGWWTGDIEGATDQLGAEFVYRSGDVHRSVQRVAVLERPSRIVWEVVDAHLAFVADPTEWTGTEIEFDIAPIETGTAVTFTHRGLTPRSECYGACSDAWRHYVASSLRQRIT